MAYYCHNNIIFISNNEVQIKELHTFLKSVPPNEAFDNTMTNIGSIAYAADIDIKVTNDPDDERPNGLGYMTEISDEIDENHTLGDNPSYNYNFCIKTESKGGPKMKIWKMLLETKFPDVKFIYYSETDENITSNDTNHMLFEDEVCIILHYEDDTDDFDEITYNNIPDAIDDFNDWLEEHENVQWQPVNSMDDIEKLAEMLADDDETFSCIHVKYVTYVSDDESNFI